MNREQPPWIQWVNEGDAQGELGEIYRDWLQANPHRSEMPGILKCFSLRPDVLKPMLGMIYPLQFADGFLTRRQKEMIATLVSGLNQCPY